MENKLSYKLNTMGESVVPFLHYDNVTASSQSRSDDHRASTRVRFSMCRLRSSVRCRVDTIECSQSTCWVHRQLMRSPRARAAARPFGRRRHVQISQMRVRREGLVVLDEVSYWGPMRPVRCFCGPNVDIVTTGVAYRHFGPRAVRTLNTSAPSD